jgi:hypothetical protein
MVVPTCFGIILPSSRSVPSAFWEMLNWGAVDNMGVLCLVARCVHHVTRHNTPIHNILSTAPQLSNTNTPIINGVFVCFSRIFLLGILIFKGLIERRLYKSFGVKGLKYDKNNRYCTLKPIYIYNHISVWEKFRTNIIGKNQNTVLCSMTFFF